MKRKIVKASILLAAGILFLSGYRKETDEKERDVKTFSLFIMAGQTVRKPSLT